MLWGMGWVLLLGWISGRMMERCHLPRLVGYLIIGILLGPAVLNGLDGQLLALAGDIRQMALMVILIKAGLTLNIKDLKQVGRPAILMCFVPALFEIIGIGLLAGYFLPLNYAESFLLASVLAAVSPAVLVPRMAQMMDQGLGVDQGIPQMVLAGGTADDILIFVLFAGFMQVNQGGSFDLSQLGTIPMTVLTGVGLGIAVGWVVKRLVDRFDLQAINFFILSLATSLVMMGLEPVLEGTLPYSGVLAVLAAHLTLRQFLPDRSQKLAGAFTKVWGVAEIFLFAFLGTAVDPRLALQAGWGVLAVIILGLVGRMMGVRVSLLGTSFDPQERAFIMGSYLPKATVQASLGGLPLMAGFTCGDLILVTATVAILLTAPLGAVFIDYFGPRWLKESRRGKGLDS